MCSRVLHWGWQPTHTHLTAYIAVLVGIFSAVVPGSPFLWGPEFFWWHASGCSRGLWYPASVAGSRLELYIPNVVLLVIQIAIWMIRYQGKCMFSWWSPLCCWPWLHVFDVFSECHVDIKYDADIFLTLHTGHWYQSFVLRIHYNGLWGCPFLLPSICIYQDETWEAICQPIPVASIYLLERYGGH